MTLAGRWGERKEALEGTWPYPDNGRIEGFLCVC
jgi:hypothetical protein